MIPLHYMRRRRTSYNVGLQLCEAISAIVELFKRLGSHPIDPGSSPGCGTSIVAVTHALSLKHGGRRSERRCPRDGGVAQRARIPL